jgi:hypothetical protein
MSTRSRRPAGCAPRSQRLPHVVDLPLFRERPAGRAPAPPLELLPHTTLTTAEVLALVPYRLFEGNTHEWSYPCEDDDDGDRAWNDRLCIERVCAGAVEGRDCAAWRAGRRWATISLPGLVHTHAMPLGDRGDPDLMYLCPVPLARPAREASAAEWTAYRRSTRAVPQRYPREAHDVLYLGSQLVVGRNLSTAIGYARRILDEHVNSTTVRLFAPLLHVRGGGGGGGGVRGDQ